MAILEYEPKAFGAPGIPPRWTRSAKDIDACWSTRTRCGDRPSIGTPTDAKRSLSATSSIEARAFSIACESFGT